MTDSQSADHEAVVTYLESLRDQADATDDASDSVRRFSNDGYLTVTTPRSSMLYAFVGLTLIGVTAALGALAFVAVMDAISPSTRQFWIVMCGIGLILGPSLTALQLCVLPLMLRGTLMTIRFILAIGACLPGITTFLFGLRQIGILHGSEVLTISVCLWVFVVTSGMLSLVPQFARGWRIIEFGIAEQSIKKQGIRWMVELTGLAAVSFTIASAIDFFHLIIGVTMMVVAALTTAIACGALLYARLQDQPGDLKASWLSFVLCVGAPFVVSLVIYKLEPSIVASSSIVLDGIFLLTCALPGGVLSFALLQLGVRHLERCGWRLVKV